MRRAAINSSSVARPLTPASSIKGISWQVHHSAERLSQGDCLLETQIENTGDL
jgi:hypothetical protein